MKILGIALAVVLVLTGCSQLRAKYCIHTAYAIPNVYCDSYTLHDGVVEGEDIDGTHFVVSGNFYIERR